ncbi:MAG: PEP-CTERM sorting domain-containing protein [Verrucomicrobia bacterium]|nr:PEP-CTERM sorting domain-containing protein [Verrucomicrobiota bacterium]
MNRNFYVKNVIVVLMLAAFTGLTNPTMAAGPGQPGAPLLFNWDDGTMQGWITISADPDLGYGPWSGWPANHEGTHGMSHGNVGDSHITEWVRSPEFIIDQVDGDGLPTSDLTFFMLGGGNRFNSNITTGEGSGALIPANSQQGTVDGTYAPMGVALRDAKTGDFLLSANRSSNAQNINSDWEQLTFTASQLQALIADDPGRVFTLDLIDAYHGDWGWQSLDTVSGPATVIPEPSSLMLMALVGLSLLGLRYRKHSAG